MAQPIPTTGVNEVVLETKDLAASERFYTEVLGFPVLDRWEGPVWEGREAVWVLGGGTRLGLWKPMLGLGRARPGVHVHFAFSVADADYDAAVATLRQRGAEVHEVDFGPGNARSAFLTDPDDHVVEFWTWDVTRGPAGPPTAVTPGIPGLPG